MLGAILGLGYAAFFGLNSVVVRRGVLRVSSNYMATLTVFSGPIFFFLVTLATGELFKIPQFTWKAVLFFALSGVIHFAFGRTFGYRSTKILGANISGMIGSLNAIVSVALAMVVLGEKMTPLVILGMCFSVSGPTLIAWKEEQTTRRILQRADPHARTLSRRDFYKGFLFGLGSALFWGSSAIFIKLGLDNGGSPVAGSLIGYSAASLVISFSLLNEANRKDIFRKDKPALKLALMSGMTTNIAQMLRYIALNYGTVIVVSLVSRTMPIWTISLNYIFNRKLESFSRWVLIGNALLIIGTILVLLR